MNTPSVLLTATVSPPKGLKLAVNTPEIRLQQYCEAVSFWNNLPGYDFPIVLFDNSGFGKDRILMELKTCELRDPDRITVISRHMNDYKVGVSYGYGELGLIDYALAHCPVLRESEYFIKATGRLTFPGVCRLLSRLPADFLFAVDARENTRFVREPQFFVTTQLMLFRTSFYKQNLTGIREELNSELNLIEDLLYQKLIIFRGAHGAILRWPVSVYPCGAAAHLEKNYSHPLRHLVNAIRDMLRTIHPNWWI